VNECTGMPLDCVRIDPKRFKIESDTLGHLLFLRRLESKYGAGELMG
jgi:hypothetical protein